MIVNHPYRLHEGIADHRSYELETPPLEVYSHSLRDQRLCRHLRQGFKLVIDRLPPYETPDISIEGTELFLDLKECLGVRDGGSDL
jgi:hypothetical protein